MRRSPGTLAENVVKCCKEHQTELLEDEVQRLSTALMGVLPEGNHPLYQRHHKENVPQNGRIEDRCVLSTPLVRQYDEVTMRQHERLNEQQRELEEMRKQVPNLALANQTSSVAVPQARFDSAQSYVERNSEEMVSSLECFSKENALLKEQLVLTALEIKHLHSDLEARTHDIIVLKHEAQRFKGNEQNVNASFMGVLKPAKQVQIHAPHPSLHSHDVDGTETMQLKNLKVEKEDWQLRAERAALDSSRAKQELRETAGQLESTKSNSLLWRAELSDLKDYVAILEGRLKLYQAQSLDVYRQVKDSMQATEHATIQRDQAFAREQALTNEVKHLQERFITNAGKVDEKVKQLLQKHSATTMGDLKATESKLRSLENSNSELRAASLNTRNGIDSSKMKRLIPTEAVRTPDYDISLTDATARPHFANIGLEQHSLDTAEKHIVQRLKHAEEMLETQHSMTIAMESEALQSIKALQEKLKRSRRIQSNSRKSLVRIAETQHAQEVMDSKERVKASDVL